MKPIYWRVIWFVLLLIPSVWQIYTRHSTYLADDGGFFLKYVENIALGNGFRFNSEDAVPIWGASAPFWPLIVAVPVLLGVDPATSIVAVGALLTILAVTLILVTLNLRYGVVAAVAFAILACSNQWVAYFATAGLESPLSILLLAIAFFNLMVMRRNPVWDGILAFLIFNHKIDFIPIAVSYGVVVILSLDRSRRDLRTFFIVFIGLTLAWVGFTWAHFGSVVPNSFATKLNMALKVSTVNARWFLDETLLSPAGKCILPFVIAAVALSVRSKNVVILYFAGVLSHVFAYTIRPIFLVFGSFRVFTSDNRVYRRWCIVESFL
jgi:hypothetical protein